MSRSSGQLLALGQDVSALQTACSAQSNDIRSDIHDVRKAIASTHSSQTGLLSGVRGDLGHLKMDIMKPMETMQETLTESNSLLLSLCASHPIDQTASSASFPARYDGSLSSKAAKAIRRLQGLASHDGRWASEYEISGVADDLRTIMTMMEGQDSARKARLDVERFNRLISATYKLTINEYSRGKPYDSPTTMPPPFVWLLANDSCLETRQDRVGDLLWCGVTKAEHNTGDGTLAIRTCIRRLHQAASNSDYNTRSPNSPTVEEYKTTLRFLPRSQSNAMFTVIVKQRRFSDGDWNFIPRLQVNNVLPAESLVFQLVRDGKLDDLKKLLVKREASLRDHDQFGNSLLVVRTHAHFMLPARRHLRDLGFQC